MFENKGRTELNQLGEFGLIDTIKKSVTLNQESSIEGIGDDAAILDLSKSTTVVSTDMLLENVHFDLAYAPLKHLGFKSVAVNISDICAMNAIPTQILVSIGISNRFSLEAVEELYLGINAACKAYNVDLIGGDTTSSTSGLVISITAIGMQDKEKIVKRSGAKEGELLCVTGDLGGAYMGLQLLDREKRIFVEQPRMQPDLEGKDYIVGRQLKPEARIDVITTLNDLSIIPTSMIDVSDGVASELHHLMEHSKVGFVVYEDKLPIDPMTYQQGIDFGIDPTVAALNGGEDYELLFTVKQTDFEAIKHHKDISIIGYCTQESEGIHLISKNDTKVPITSQGWNAFKKND
jgi:thiamine-monophosphate kinase